MHSYCLLHKLIQHITIVLVDLCDNIGLVGVSAKWSYVTASPSHRDQAIPILSPLLFMHVGHPYIPLFKILRIFDLLVSPPFLVAFRQVYSNPSIHVYAHNTNNYPNPHPLSLHTLKTVLESRTLWWCCYPIS